MEGLADSLKKNKTTYPMLQILKNPHSEVTVIAALICGKC